MKINIKEILTLPTYILASLAVASGGVLLLPEAFIRQLYLSAFREQYGFIVGIVFVVSTSILIVSFSSWLFRLIRKKWNVKKFYEKGERKLNALNGYQKAIIYMLYQEDNRTALLPLYDGAISELEYNKMIGKVGSTHMVSMLNPAISYMLQPWVIRILDEDTELLTSFRHSYHEFNKLS